MTCLTLSAYHGLNVIFSPPKFTSNLTVIVVALGGGTFKIRFLKRINAFLTGLGYKYYKILLL